MHRKSLSYFLIVLQAVIFCVACYLFLFYKLEGKYIIRAMKYHLWIDILNSIFIVYGLFRFINTLNASSRMRKAAGAQKEIKSKMIQLLILFLMVSLVFYSLYYTVPMAKYVASNYQRGIYYFTSGIQLVMLVSLIGSHEKASMDFVKSKQKYAGVGAAIGLLLFYTYFVLLN